MQLARAVLFVKDLPAMTAFYRDTLGFTVTSGSAGWIEFDAGPVALALHAIPAAIAARIVIDTPARVREQAPVKLSFAVPDVAAERARLAAAGVVMREVRSGGCDGVDPEGNVFQLIAR
jgi:catechol 2,3-dioxygenase-like lactoylglutathione lyase family enzyme